MSRIWTVAGREFIETVKTKAFFISTVLVPMVIVLLTLGSKRIAEATEKEAVPTRVLDVVDETGRVFDTLQALIEQENAAAPHRKLEARQAPADADRAALRARVDSGERYGYIVIPAGAAPSADRAAPGTSAAGASAPAEAPGGFIPCELGRRDNLPDVAERLRRLLDRAVNDLRLRAADPPIDPRRVRALQARVFFNEVDVKTGQPLAGDEMVRFMTPFVFMFLLFMGTMTISQGLLTSMIEEKSSRIVEVLLSAISPMQLMAGKILGMVCVGGVLMGVWAVVGYSGARSRGMEYLVTPTHLGYMAAYFLPAFLLFSSLLAAAGAACNTVKDAQSLAAPVTLLTFVPLMLWWVVMFNPNSALSLTLSFIPPMTPFVMILRICADPKLPAWQIVASLALLWASVVASIWFASRVFRVGVLMYGKAPSLRELAKWVRYA